MFLESSLPITFDQFLEIYYGQLRCKNDYVLVDKRVHPQLFVINFTGPQFVRAVTKINMELQNKQQTELQNKQQAKQTEQTEKN